MRPWICLQLLKMQKLRWDNRRNARESNWSVRNVHAEIFSAARAAVGDIIVAAERPLPTRMSLLLEQHYPFFDNDVQSILWERHPEQEPKVEDYAYAVDAYLWAEQYGWIAYDDSEYIFNKDSQFIDYHASFFLTRDLLWFSRLLTAIAADIERCIGYAQGDTDDPSHETILQTWRNFYVSGCGDETIKKPAHWLEGTAFHAKSNYKDADPMPSFRVSASKINKKRRAILKSWLPCWKAELELLSYLLQAEAARSVPHPVC